MIINKCNKYKKQHQKDQETTKAFEKLFRRNLQDSVIDEKESESLCKYFTKYLDEAKNEPFL